MKNCYYCGEDLIYKSYKFIYDVSPPEHEPTLCCLVCNTLKGSFDRESFLSKIEKIYTHLTSNDKEKRCVFVGRWQPFHKAHEALIRTKLDQGSPCLVLVRATPIDENNPYTLSQTIEMVRAAFQGENVKVLPITDISGIYYGRKVGYEVKEIDMPETTKMISATMIRNGIKNKDDNWKNFVHPKIAEILEKIHFS